MTDERAERAERLAKITADMAKPENRARTAAEQERKAATRKKAVDLIAEQLLGVRPEHGDTIYTQHPLMAGVLRQALGACFDAGGDECAIMFVKALIDGPPPAGGR